MSTLAAVGALPAHAVVQGVVQGVVLPESTIYSTWFAVFSAFVAINTLIYVTLAGLKTLPVMRPRDWFPRTYVRAETRSIYPEADEPGPAAAVAGDRTVTPVEAHRPPRPPRRTPVEGPLTVDEVLAAPPVPAPEPAVTRTGATAARPASD